jgi:hypothetical protein
VDCPIGLHIDARGMTWKQWNNPSDKSWHLEEEGERLNYRQPPVEREVSAPRRDHGRTRARAALQPIRRNVFVDCRKQVCDFDGNVKKLLDKFEIAENLVVNSAGATNGIAKAVDLKGFVNLSGTAEEPVDLGFADRARGDFALRWRARLRKELPAFEPIPFEKIGLYKDEYRRKLPER